MHIIKYTYYIWLNFPSYFLYTNKIILYLLLSVAYFSNPMIPHGYQLT